MSRPQEPRNSSELTAEREALEELVRTQGWGIFLKRLRDEWVGAGYHSRMGMALNSADPLSAKVVHRVSKEMLAMVDWPKQRIQHLGGLVE